MSNPDQLAAVLGSVGIIAACICAGLGWSALQRVRTNWDRHDPTDMLIVIYTIGPAIALGSATLGCLLVYLIFLRP